jgi:hypothetical protein
MAQMNTQEDMAQSYVSQVVHTLQPEEVERFGQFIHSPYHYGGQNKASLEELLLALLAGLDDEGSEAEDALYGRVFKGASYVKGKLDKLKSELLGLLRQFLLVERYLNDDNGFRQALDWAIIHRERNLLGKYPNAIAKAERVLAQHTLESAQFHLGRFQIAHEEHFAESIFNRGKGNLAIPQAITNLNNYYLVQWYELANLLLLQQKITKLEDGFEPISLLPNAIQLAKDAGFSTIKAYAIIHQELQKDIPSKAAIEEILDILVLDEGRIDLNVLQQCYAYLRSICGMLIQRGEQDFVPVLFRIQRHNLAKGYLHYNGKLHISAYLSLAKIGLVNQAYDWTIAFIETEKNNLMVMPDEAESYYLFNKANYYFATRQYQSALDCIPNNFKDLMYQLNCKRLELKIYFELDSPLFPFKLDAYKMLISRASKKTMADEVKNMEMNFVNSLYKVVNCTPGHSTRIAKIRQQVMEKGVIAERDWLMEKINAL